MRIGARLVLFSALTMVISVLIGCSGSDSPTSPLPAPSPAPVYTLSDSTTFIPPEHSADIQAFDPASGSVSLLDASEFGQAVEVGDIIIGQNDQTAPNGFLRKITQKTIDRGAITLETSPAAMADAFESMAISDSTQLPPSEIRSSKMMNGSTLIPDKDDKTFSVDLNCILYDQDGNHETTEDQIKLVGQYSFDAKLMADIEIDYYELTKFEISIKTEKEVSLQLLANLEWEFDYERQIDLAEFRLGAIPIGGVVWMVPTLSVEAHVHGDLTVTFETSITYTETMTNGFGYASGNYYQINQSSKNFTYTPPELSAEFNFEAGASLNASCLLFGVAGPYVAGKVGFQFTAELGVDTCAANLAFGLDAILYAVVGIECDILDMDFNQQYQLYLHEIGDWNIPIGGVGTVNVNTGPIGLDAAWSVTGPCNFTLSGVGDLVTPNLAVGDYSVVWSEMSGWITPQNQALTLTEQSMITFNGNYIFEEGTGTVTVDAQPDSINASWVLTGPNSYHHMGEGDETIRGLAPGSYLLNWRYKTGWISPENIAGNLVEGQTLDFAGTYEVDPNLGTIEVDAEPDLLNATWTLTGPENYTFSGEGDQAVSQLLPGEYLLTWGEIEGWIRPENSAVTLSPNGLSSISGTYVEETGAGSVVINANPDSIETPWHLYGPNNFTTSGTGDETLNEMEAGLYLITWGMVEGYVAPESETTELQAEGSITFNGIYVGSARIELDPNPDSLDAPWSITGPDGFSNSGNGDANLTQLIPGDYTVSWGSVAGWISPPDSTQYLWDQDFLNFSCVFSQESVPLLDFVPISPGSFTMGSDAASTETPHEVTLTGSLIMSNTEITNAQMVSALQFAYNFGYITASTTYARDALDGSTAVLLVLDNPLSCQISFENHTFSTTAPDEPVVGITWYGAVSYCDWLSLQEGLPRAYNHNNWSCNSGNPYAATGYRLPTEAEWEYSCRAGSATHFNTGDCLNANSEANYDGTDPYDECSPGQNLEQLTNVGSYPANSWGLYDMHGNVYEWCNDLYGLYSGDATNPVGASSSTGRVFRGGSWFNDGGEARSARRRDRYPDSDTNTIGVRVVKSSS